MGRLQYFVQLTSTHLLCYEDTRVVAKVALDTLKKDVPLRVNKKWCIVKRQEAPEEYKVTYSFDYTPDINLYVTHETPIVPFRVSAIAEVILLLVAWAVCVFLILTRAMGKDLFNDDGFLSNLFSPFVILLVMVQSVACVRYKMLQKQNKIYYSWF